MSDQNDQRSVVEKFMDSSVRDFNPHLVAREITVLYNGGDVDGAKRLREAYIAGLGKKFPEKNIDRIRYLADENLIDSAVVADIVRMDGYEASGQLLGVEGIRKNCSDLEITDFFQKAIGYC